jgi:hypothetical protein
MYLLITQYVFLKLTRVKIKRAVTFTTLFAIGLLSSHVLIMPAARPLKLNIQILILILKKYGAGGRNLFPFFKIHISCSFDNTWMFLCSLTTFHIFRLQL